VKSFCRAGIIGKVEILDPLKAEKSGSTIMDRLDRCNDRQAVESCCWWCQFLMADGESGDETLKMAGKGIVRSSKKNYDPFIASLLCQMAIV
jgi:hypothetical protein